jgi:hypothetical protein
LGRRIASANTTAGAADRNLSWDDFVAGNGPLIANARARLAAHYSNALLQCAEARARFVAPDLLPLAPVGGAAN